MIPDASFVELSSRLRDAIYMHTLYTTPLPPFKGTQKAPHAAALCSQSVLKVAKGVENAPTCKISATYRSHSKAMGFDFYVFYNNELKCGIAV
ncbi:unnamed protein product [Haemonchus placei]|uniref:Histone acetyltransferase n=1 Tax=Haemonchus placei TaxID=6290 RepID=A0A0N4WRD3_HAEPC|nr:unnamed protein product [Haemonchus placei]